MKTKKEWDAREELAGNDLAVVTGGAKGVLIGAKSGFVRSAARYI